MSQRLCSVFKSVSVLPGDNYFRQYFKAHTVPHSASSTKNTVICWRSSKNISVQTESCPA